MAIFSNYWKTRVVRYPMLAVSAISALIATGIDQGLNKGDWSGWMQAIGAIGAILGAFFVGERQARATLVAITNADLLAARRKARAVQAIADTAVLNAYECQAIFQIDGFNYLEFLVNYSDAIAKEISETLNQVSVVELGTYEAVRAFLMLKQAFHNMRSAIDRIAEPLQSAKTGVAMTQICDTSVVLSCANSVLNYAEDLRLEFLKL